MYDVIVIGARCAGASTAMLLARRGLKVLLVDRAKFPSDIPHGHFIHRHGPPRLARWGLLDRITATGCPAVTSCVMDLGDFPLAGHDLAVDGVAFGYGPRRSAVDQVLVEAAVEAGADFRDGFAFDDVLVDGEDVVGIRGRSGGAACTERGRVIVGADGRRSRVAAAVKAAAYDAYPVLACWYFSYWSGVAVTGLEMYNRDQRVVFAFPTNGGLTGIFVGWPIERLPAVRADVDAHLLAAVDAVPGFGERVRNGRREERYYGAADLPNFFRTPFGRGWALVGDAGLHKDPYLALGMCDALRDAESLAEAVHDGMSGRAGLQEALAAYERVRNQVSRQDYLQNLHAAGFNPPPEPLLRMREAVRGDQQATNQFFLAREGLIPKGRPRVR